MIFHYSFWQNGNTGLREETCMTDQERKLFSALSKKRAGLADALFDDFAARGIKDSVVDKYTDQTHFIYELLQNADDTSATTVRFVLRPSHLVFAHNGTRLFSISDPANEKQDHEEGKLGDINSITAIGGSNKPEASIGKFGFGFKAVFQYTETPYIYDPNFRFKIEHFIVPVELDEDIPERRPDETLFVFPFDHHERTPNEAYADIADKLKHLSFPLLFLSNLKNIEFEFGDVVGLYNKETKRSYSFGDITAEHICLTQNNGDDFYEENLWLFSRSDSSTHRYSVGFFLDENGKLRPVNEPAFCFFPTKETTGLNFIIHAPFLLTDNREGIKARIPHNDNMIQQLADLAAKALVCLKEIGNQESLQLIDDNILEIIPYNREEFNAQGNKGTISFRPFYEQIQKAFQEEEIIPSIDGYVTYENAYWAEFPQLPQLFSNNQLKHICCNNDAKWAFVTKGRYETNRSNKELLYYIDTIVKTHIDEKSIISGRQGGSYYNSKLSKWLPSEKILGITASFIEAQTTEWLNLFYRWLSETKNRREAIIQMPIFLNQDKKATAAFDSAKQPSLFLPVDDVAGFDVIHPELLENPDTYTFIKEIGIKKPSLRDQIYKFIIPLYSDNIELDTDSHFKTFFDYYCNHCEKRETAEFIDLIKNLEFLTYYTTDESVLSCGVANTMYLPNAVLKQYFETTKGIRFLELDKYLELVGISNEGLLYSFLEDLGIKKYLRVETEGYNYYSTTRKDIPHPKSRYHISYEEGKIPGCKEIVQHIASKKDKEKSLLLWNCLLSIISLQCTINNPFSNLLRGTCKYFYYTEKEEYYSSLDELTLKQSAWLVNSDNQFVTANDITKTTLSCEYDTISPEAQELIAFLGIIDDEKTQESETEDANVNLSESLREEIAFARSIRAKGFTDEDFEELERIKQKREEKQKRSDRYNSNVPSENTTENQDSDNNELFDSSDVFTEENMDGDDEQFHEFDKKDSGVVRDIVRRIKKKPSASVFDKQETEETPDQDEYMPPAVDYNQRIERAIQKSASEIDKLNYLDDLQNRAVSLPKYSFGWFKALLELESITGGNIHSDNKEVSISFAKVEREPGTSRTLVLKHPSRYIPQFMEDLADIPLVLHMGDTKKTVAIEVANIKSYSLRVKLKSGADIDGIDLTSVNAATIDAKSPVFLLEALRKEFADLGYADDFNMRDNLCGNIEFVFGPPGTGKTTYLARKVLLPLMHSEDNCKVLVLTPTNKAADVLVRRIMEISEEDRSFEEWLVRFGATGDEEIEQSPVFRDKTFDINTLSKHVTITTIARFPYDFFMPPGKRISLNEINWDYIVIDEASMIPIANIVYPLYKKTPWKFIIAGDPFQIEPIASVNLWKNENIYSLVQLHSFGTPKTVPHNYKVELLTTQYRSIPEIGEVFSKLTYDGILEHYRASKSQRPLNLDREINIKALNIIKFPVSKYESIYRPKRLQQSSSYQIYSAIFTYEYICFLSKKIATTNPESLFKIGVIAPYRAQADLIDKLLASEPLTKEVDVQVGTIHGFQGDECDIIFAVFNTPPTISTSKEMFLNKRNIINVSISRAKDYLFIVMPDDDTDNIGNLQLVKNVEYLIKKSNAWTEVTSSELETMMFGSSNYLESNAFSTSHQSVNVYGLPERCYEVRTEDNAVDIQIHRNMPT